MQRWNHKENHPQKCIVAVLLLALLHTTQAAAQTLPYPNKPVRLIVAAPPGGGTDLLARVIGARLAQKLGQPFVVDNRGGAGGNIAALAVANAAPDGYTLLVTNSQLTATSAMAAAPAFDPIKDLASIGLVGRQPIVMGVGSNVPARSLRELVGLIRSQPGRYAYASCGQGTPLHLSGAAFNLSAGIDMAHVPYRGCGPAMVDVVGGQVPVFFTILGNALPYAKTGQVRILGVGSSKRLAGNPDIPTIAESGYPTFEVFTWFGFLAPSGVSSDLAKRINSELNFVLAEADTSEKLKSMQFEPATGSTESFAELLRNDMSRWSYTISNAGIKKE